MSPDVDGTGALAGATASDAAPPAVIVRGAATPEEVAAVVAVLVAASGASSDAEAPRTSASRWADPERSMRGPHHHGPGTWRASGRR